MSEIPNANAPAPKQKVCEACGETFSCCALAGPCWCDEVKISKETLAILRARYADCLCEKCLNAAAKNDLPAGGAHSQR